MGSYGRLLVGKNGQCAVTEETAFGTFAAAVLQDGKEITSGMFKLFEENKLDKALRLMGVNSEKDNRIYTPGDFARKTLPFRIKPSEEYDVNAMYRKFLKV